MNVFICGLVVGSLVFLMQAMANGLIQPPGDETPRA